MDTNQCLYVTIGVISAYFSSKKAILLVKTTSWKKTTINVKIGQLLVNFSELYFPHKNLNSKFYNNDGITIISVIVHMLTNYLRMPLIYLTAAPFFHVSEGVNVNANLRILWFGSLFYHQRENHGALSRPSQLLYISILSDYETEPSFINLVIYLEKWLEWIHIWRDWTSSQTTN